MGFLDAFFGRVFDSGTELDLRGGLNCKNGIQVVADASNNRNDVSLIAALQQPWAVAGVGHLVVDTPAACTLDEDTWSPIGGTFALGAANGSNFSLGTAAALQWDGAESVIVLIVATLGIQDFAASKTLRFRVTVDGVGDDDSEIYFITTGAYHEPSQTVIAAVSVGSGEELEVEIRNDTDGSDPVVQRFNMFAVALLATGL